jgi:hypothetical protein
MIGNISEKYVSGICKYQLMEGDKNHIENLVGKSERKYLHETERIWEDSI